MELIQIKIKLRVKMNLAEINRFHSVKTNSENFEGMLSPFSTAVMDSILSFQLENNIFGNQLEMGVYKGKSASVMCHYALDNETVWLMDINDQLNRDKLIRITNKFNFITINTENLSQFNIGIERSCCKFIHIDASHMFNQTQHEIKIADSLLQDNGVLCLDDFTNLNFSQILAATFKYLYTEKTDLRIFLVTEEKAYLCRKKYFNFYGKFIIDSIRGKMEGRGISKTCIARTDKTDLYAAFYLRNQYENENDDIYGRAIYSNYYSNP